MNMTMRRIIAAVLAILVIIGLILLVRACVGPAPEPVKIKSGESAKFGGIQWSVISVLKTKEVGAQESRLNAKGWFLIVDFYLTNKSTSKITLNPGAFTLSDGGGKKFEIDKEATDAQIKGLANPKLASIYSAGILPNAKQRVVLVFEIPETASKLTLTVLGSSVGMDRDLKIDLGF